MPRVDRITSTSSAQCDRSEAGLTIVELMIAMLLAIVLSGGLFYMASGQQRSYTEQIESTSLQINLVGAMQLLQREVQRAGYGFPGCPSGIIGQGAVVQRWDTSSATGRSPAFAGLTVYNDCNVLLTNPAACPDNSGVDSFEVMYQNDEPARGALPGLRTTFNRPQHDVTDGCGAGSCLYTPVLNPGNFTRGDFVVMWDALSSTKECTLLQVTGTGADRLLHDANTINPPAGVPYFPGGGYPSGSSAVRLGPNSVPRYFAVDTRVDPPRLVTWRSWAADPSSDTATLEVIGDGIEDMQISWACDVVTCDAIGCSPGTNNVLDEDITRVDDDWANNVLAAAPGPGPDVIPNCGTRNMRAVRITLIGRGNSPIPGDQNANLMTGRPAAEDHAAGTAAEDKAINGIGPYPRSVLRTTIETLNLQ